MNRAIEPYNLGTYHLNVTEDYDRALSYFKLSIAANPEYSSAYGAAAECFIRKGDLVEAGKRIEAALSRWPRKAPFHHTMSFVLLKAGDYDGAIKEAQVALSLDPEMFRTLGILGEAFRLKGKIASAANYWERYLQTNPDFLEGNLALIELYARQNRKDDLSRTIGRVMVLKGSKSWASMISQLNKKAYAMAYTPVPEKIIGIVRVHLKSAIGPL